ncbi:MAG: helix-turn-helix domain-containing protein [Lepagella sp.]
MTYYRQHIFLPVIIAIITLSAVMTGCRKEDSSSRDKTELEGMRLAALDAAMKENFRQSDSIGKALYRKARENRNDVYMAYGLLSQGYYQMTDKDIETRLAKVKEAEKIALTTNNDTLLSRVYNVLGNYATMYHPNFAQAHHYYLEAIKYARNCGSRTFEIAAECNISELYAIFEDTLSMKYDRDIYEFAIETDNPSLLRAAAYRCADYYTKRPGEERRALPYIKALRDFDQTYHADLAEARYYMALDSLPEAERSIKQALEGPNATPAAYVNYGKVLNLMGKYNESNIQLLEAKKVSIETSGYDRLNPEMFRLLSDNYRQLGNSAEAIKYLDIYIQAQDSIKEIHNTNEINTYKVKFEVEKKELELRANRQTIKSQRIMIYSIITIILITICFYIFYQRRQHRIRKVIVRQQKDFQREIDMLESPENESEEDEKDADTSTTTNGLSSQRADAIWQLILHEMEKNRIYADTTVTRDIFSERIGCNHTWFSQVIKEKTGKTYLQFMNSWRIKEAVRILSSDEEITSQKDLATSLGFLSPSTFYTTFKQQIGMSPAEYRKISLSDRQNNDETDDSELDNKE